MITQAVILARGLGSRPGDPTERALGPMMEVAGRPFLEYLIWNLKRHGIKNLLLGAGYLREKIIDRFGDGSGLGVSIEYAVEEESAGEAGALLLVRERLDPLFFVIKDDTLFDVNYLDLALFGRKTGAPACVALKRVENTQRYGRVVLERDTIREFKKEGDETGGLISGGTYLLDRGALGLIEEITASLESELFPALAKRGELAGKSYDGFFIDIAQPETLDKADELIASWARKPAVFFDRDGVVNQDDGYVHRPEDFRWITGAREAVRWLNDHGYLVIVITNQSGIARGYYTEEDFFRFTDWIQEQLCEYGAHIDATYHCPHHPVEGRGEFKTECDCRKPKPGLILRAIQEWSIDPQRSVLVGDKPWDMEAAKAAGIEAHRFSGGDLCEFIAAILGG